MARRRALGGRPLLVAAGGLALTVACTGGASAPSDPPEQLQPPPPLNNPVPPPTPPPTPTITGELCVDVVPRDAIVRVDGARLEQRCGPVTGAPGSWVRVSAEANGYTPRAQRVTLAPSMTVSLDLADGQPPRPVGNLMPPPLPPSP